MKRPTLVAALIAQTVLLFAVAWAGVYFARDEFLLATGRQGEDDDEGLAKAAAITEENGVPTVRLSLAAQRNVGLEVAMPEAARRGDEATLPVVVIDPQPLVELQGRLRAARHEAEAARATAVASAAERQRVQGLFDDDRNASQRALDAAMAQAGADAARERAAAAALQALRSSARASWGAELARELEAEGPGLIGRLSTGTEVLLRAALRGDEAVPTSARLSLSLPGRSQPLNATPLGAAGAGANGADAGGGRSLLFRAGGTGLAVGQRLNAQLRHGGAAQDGVLVPTSALVWHAGQPWIYIRETNEAQPVSPVTEPDGASAAAPTGASTAATTAATTASAAKAASEQAVSPGKAPAKPAHDDDDDDKPRSAAAKSAAAPTAATATPAASAGAAPGVAASAAEPDLFQRRAVPHARRVGDRWFLPGYAEDDPVVVQGAQLLLSEELKFLIRNENDD